MNAIVALILLVGLIACRPVQDGSVAISEIESLATSGYRGPIVVSGYYFYHSEQDAVYQVPRPDLPGTPKVLLQMTQILESANIAPSDWSGRRRFMQVFDRQLVTVTGELRSEVFRTGGVQIDDPPPRTFIRAEKLELANQSAQTTPVSAPR